MQLLWKKRQLELKDAESKIHNSAKAMQTGTDILLNTSSHDNDKIQILKNMEYEVQQLDNAMDFATIGGLAATINLLDHSNFKIRKYAAWVIGTAVKNYDQVQEELLKLGGIDTFINVIQLESKGLATTTETIAKKTSNDDDEDENNNNEEVKTIDVIGKQLYGLGASIRGSLRNSNYFFQRNGSKLLYKLLNMIKKAIDVGPLNQVAGPQTTNGDRAWTPETMVLKRKLCGVQNKVLNLIGDNLNFAIDTIQHFGGVEMQDGTNGMLIARSLTTVEWCKMLNDISESLCDDDVSREKILRALQIILQIAKRNGATYEDNFDATAGNNNDDNISLSKCFNIIHHSNKLKTALNGWKKEWSDAILEDPTDDYAKDLSNMVDSVLNREESK